MNLYWNNAWEQHNGKEGKLTGINVPDKFKFEVKENSRVHVPTYTISSDHSRIDVWVPIEVDKNYGNYVRARTFTIANFYGNCGICILSCMDGNTERKTQEVWDFAIFLAEKMGYSMLLYSVADYQEYIIKQLVKNGFELLKDSPLENVRSGHTISIYQKAIDGDKYVPQYDADDEEDY